MAIYNNREVSVLGPNSMANTPETINVRHTNGATENVRVSSVYFTQEEKDKLVKSHPSKYNDVKITSKEDVDAVRTGVAPSFDPSYADAAAKKVHADKQAEINKKNTDLAKANADKAEKKTSTSTPAPVAASPGPAHPSYQVPNQASH